MRTLRTLPLLSLTSLLLAAACGPRDVGKKVVVLGFDGMDPKIVRKMFDAGGLPNLAALAQQGGFWELGTAVPPESPVAWANFATGRNPGGHGIFDFIHRDPATYECTSSAATAEPPGWKLPLFGYKIPLTGGGLVNQCRGKTFWQILDEAGVPCFVYRMPGNYPPASTGAISLTGMNTPDIRGGYGIYSYYTEVPPENMGSIVKGDVYLVSVDANDCVRATIKGPPNVLKEQSAESGKREKDTAKAAAGPATAEALTKAQGEKSAAPTIVNPDTKASFYVFLDREHEVAKIVTSGEEAIVREGEWSPFLKVDFDLIPHVQSVSGIVQFYMKEITPSFKLYASPVNFNPEVSGAHLSTPEDACADLAEAIGRYYTQGMAEATNALKEGVLSDAEFIGQTRLIMDESHRMLEHALAQLESGLLFFYYSTSDLLTHMMWRHRSADHPAYDPAIAGQFATATEKIYEELDGVVGRVREALGPKDVLIVMSDHGFAPYTRSFNLNTWLVENGYMVLKPPPPDAGQADRKVTLTADVDWSQTRAYGIGFNALYVNLQGREEHGIVPPAQRNALVDEIAYRLAQVIDPKTGEPAILKNYKTSEIYSGEAMREAPDLVVGFKAGYGASDQSAMGEIEESVFKDNKSRWSGSHLMAAEEVPGVLFSSIPIKCSQPTLVDLTVGVLQLFGVAKDPSMVGQPVF
ncbi:MAG: alkaline phosphatase family protein [Planctomycetota bacterium]